MIFSSLRRSAHFVCALAWLAAGTCLAQDAPATPTPATTNESKGPADSIDEAAAAASTLPPRQSFFKRWFSVEAVTSTLPAAAVEQLHDWPSEWGGKRIGFEKRVASLYGQFVIGVSIEAGVKAIHHEDTRYRRQGHGNFFARTAHVVADTVTARADDGSRNIAWSMPANAYGSWAIATLWSPHEYRRAGSILYWGTAGMGSFAAANFLREYWPDVKAIFHRKK